MKASKLIALLQEGVDSNRDWECIGPDGLPIGVVWNMPSLDERELGAQPWIGIGPDIQAANAAARIRSTENVIRDIGCGARLAPGQHWAFCGETDMGSLPALCTECGGEYQRAP